MKQNSAAGNTALEVSVSLHSASREEAKAAEGLLLQAVGAAAAPRQPSSPGPHATEMFCYVLLPPPFPALGKLVTNEVAEFAANKDHY